ELGLRGVHDDLLGGELPERHRAQSWSHDHPFILPARVSPYPSIWRKPPWFRADWGGLCHIDGLSGEVRGDRGAEGFHGARDDVSRVVGPDLGVEQLDLDVAVIARLDHRTRERAEIDDALVHVM